MARRKRSALGEYVHLSVVNYKKYGIAHINEKPQPFSASERFLNNRISKIKSVNRSTIDLLKARLEQNADSKVLQEQGGVGLNYEEKVNQIWEFLADISGQGAIGYGVGTSKNAPWAYTGDYQTNIKNKALTPEELERVKKEYEVLGKRIDKINEKGEATEQELQDIINTFEKFNKVLNIDPESEEFESIMAKIQNAMDNCYVNATKQALVGDFGEHYAAIADDYIYNLAGNAFIEALPKHVIGQERSAWRFTKENFPSYFQSYLTKDDKKNIFKVNSTQDKVDIEIEVNGQTVYGSVKNYYDAGKVGLQSSISLAAALTYLENKEKFGTHWLNMHAGSIRGFSADIKKADDILEKEIGYEALVAGNPLKQGTKQANVFIHLNRANGDVQVWSTRDLLVHEFHRLNISPSVRDIILDNTYSHNSAEERIAKLLLDLHQIEISVSLTV